MHHALQLHEILVDIFRHIPSWRKDISDLAILARTCQAFKEPALDLLWEELDGLSPLVRCLPKASSSEFSTLSQSVRVYLFIRPLTPTEWDVLRSYTRRVRRIRNFSSGLSWKSVGSLMDPPTADLIFPNLRNVHCASITKCLPLLRQPMPSLSSVDFNLLYEDLGVLVDLLGSFHPENIRKMSLHVLSYRRAFDHTISSYICRSQNLQHAYLTHAVLDVDALLHLACIPSLTRLKLRADHELPGLIAPISPLSFPTLDRLELRSNILDPISHFLSCTRFPSLRRFTAHFTFPRVSKQEVSSFFTSVQSSGIGDMIQTLRLIQETHSQCAFNLGLDLEDLRPCMAFSELSHIEVDIGWKVGLRDGELLEFASSWPCLKHLKINKEHGWHKPGGITPEGLLRLLQICPSLREIALAVDTQGYTESPTRESLESFGATIPREVFINVLDSAIEAESVPAIAAFLAGVVPPSACASNYFITWATWGTWSPLGPDVAGYPGRWDNVLEQVDRLCVTESG